MFHWQSYQSRLQQLGFFTYGRVIPGVVLTGGVVATPVVNARAVRVGAGILFVLGSFSFVQAFFLGEFGYLRLLVLLLVFDFTMKTIVGLRFSPLSWLSNQIVSGYAPVYVEARARRFAWSIGLALALSMTILLYGFAVQGTLNVIICAVCLTLLFFESVFGICIGCRVYNALFRR